MGTITKVRGSSADRALACSGSIPAPEFPIQISSDTAHMGDAVHAACALMAEGGDPDLVAIASGHGVPLDELGMLFHFAEQAWADVRKHFPNPQTEVRLEGPVTRGTADVLSATRKVIAVLDWKSGSGNDEHPGQLMAYADAARAQLWEPDSGEIVVFEVWLRDRELRVHRITMAELDGFRLRMEDQLRHQGEEFSPGAHCNFCPHSAGCSARTGYIRSSVTSLMEPGAATLALKDSEEIGPALGAIWDRTRAVKKALAAYEKLVDAALKAGPIPIGDGRRLESQPSASEKLDPMAAWSALELIGFDDDDIAKTLTMSKTKVLAVVRSKLGEDPAKGEVGKAKGRALTALRRAGSISEVLGRRRKIVKEGGDDGCQN